MNDLLRRRVTAVVAVAVVLTGVLAVASDAGHEASPASVTGCLKTSTGLLSRVAVGDTPLSACPSGQVEVHLSGGDLTAVTAGTGLSGGGSSGAPTLDVDFADFGSCPTGSAIRVVGGAATCEADDDTTYSAGSGLALTGTTFDVDYSAFGFCPAGSSIRVVGTSATCEADDDTTYAAGSGLTLTGTTFAMDDSAVQARVTGTCAVGSAIREITQDGLVVCESIPAGGSGAGEPILIQRHEFDTNQDYFNLGGVDWETIVTGGAAFFLDPELSPYITSALTMDTQQSPFTAGSVVVRGKRQAAVSDGTLIFKTRILDAYAEPSGAVYGNAQPRGLVNGTDRNNAIEFVNAGGPGATLVTCRTVAAGGATETTVDIGQWVRHPAVYQIVATPTEAKFYVNGVLKCTHTSFIPTFPLNVYFATSDGGAGNVPVTIDWVEFEQRQ